MSLVSAFRPLRPAAGAALPLAAALLAGAAAPAAAQQAPPGPKSYAACYVASTGTVYRIDKPAGSAPGAPAACGSTRKAADTEFSWVDGDQAVRLTSAAGGDVAGTFGDLSVAKLLGRALSTTPPAAGQVLQWDGESWAPATPAAGASDHGGLQGLTDDDHPHYLLAGGSRAAPNGFAVTGAIGDGGPLTSGPGTRLVWYPGKAAFRAGQVNGTQWDDANIAPHSVALGFNSTASGTATTAIGYQATATLNGATALGFNTTASGIGATATGLGTAASGVGAAAAGGYTKASGDYSTASGNSTTAAGAAATALGEGTVASGNAATALGSYAKATGIVATAIGNVATADGDFSTALGRRAWTNGQAGSFVYGDNSTNSNGAFVTAAVPNEFVVRAAGGFRFRTAADLSSGCNIAGGNLTCTGTVTGSSSRLLKHDFRAVDAEAVLAKVAALDVRSWRYTADSAADVRHLGPVAEEFRAAFGLGANATTISMVDADGVNMLAIQALETRDRARRTELATLRAENAALRTRLERIEAALGRP